MRVGTSQTTSDYVIAVQAPAYAISPTEFATESAFAAHLKELRHSIGPRFKRLVLIAPQLPEAQYQTKRNHLGTVHAERDGIEFVPTHPTDASIKSFWLSHAWSLWKRVRTTIDSAGIVHTGMATDTYRPMLLFVNLAAWLKRRPVMFFVDIDSRQNSRRNHQLGIWSRKSYAINRLIHDPMRWIQVWMATRCFSLVMLKSASMVRDFGRGRPQVKNFYDTAHALGDVLTDDQLQSRLVRMRQPGNPLRVTFFGRLIPYKGLERAVEAVRLARQQGAHVELTLIGEGACLAALKKQVADTGLGEFVTFVPPVLYGPALFELVDQADLSIATPLIEDTPRAAFDSMARGLPILAFDISYFRDLAELSGAVALAQWPEPSALAHQMVALDKDRSLLTGMAERGVKFARENTQAVWLERRATWMREVLT